jgi:hypothetical protein
VFATIASLHGATVSTGVPAVFTQGRISPGDGGDATYLLAPVQSAAPNREQSADGQYWEYKPGPAGICPNAFGAVGDGVALNDTPWNNFLASLKLYGRTQPLATVTIAPLSGAGTAAVISWPAHGRRLNDAIFFSTTGTLPTGLTPGVAYYVITPGFLADSFRVATSNNYDQAHGEGAAVTITGTGTGTHSAAVGGERPMQIYISPGHYLFSNSNPSLSGGNQKSCIVSAYGASMIHVSAGQGLIGQDQTFNFNSWSYIQSAFQGQSFVVVDVVAHASRFFVGQWIFVGGLDLQNAFGSQNWPPNCQYNQHLKITAINTSTGRIDLNGQLWSDLFSTWPKMNDGTAVGVPIGSGAAFIIGMGTTWDNETEVRGLTITGPGPDIGLARELRLTDVHHNGAQSFNCGSSKRWINTRCRFGNRNPAALQGMEIDKLMEYVEFNECTADAINFVAPGGYMAVIDRCDILTLSSTARNMKVSNSIIQEFDYGQFFGANESLILENNKISKFVRTTRLDDPLASSAVANMVENWTFSGGTLKQPIATTNANWWAVPGRKMFVNDMAGIYDNMGSPFTVRNVFVDGSGNFSIETDLAALPVGNSTKNTAVSFTGSNVNWTAHGLPANTPVAFLPGTGTLPSPLSPGQVVFVLAAPPTNTFQVATTVGGVALTFSGGTGPNTGVSNPLHFQPHPCVKLTARANRGDPHLMDLNGADNEPIFGRSHRSFGGYTTDSVSFYTDPVMWGLVNQIIINITRPSSFAGDKVAISGTGFNNLTPTAYSETIDLTVGPRVITITPSGFTIVPSSSTGPNDILAALNLWLGGQTNIRPATANGGAINQNAVFTVTMTTDQGITRNDLTSWHGPNDSHIGLWADTTVIGNLN